MFTLKGAMEAAVGDYIIKGIKGEFYPCKEKIFRDSYQIIDANKKVEGDHIPDTGEMVEKEPPDFLEIYVESDLCFDGQDELELLFLAGKRRGRWEAAQQKYNTAKEAYLATGGGETSFPIFEKIWNLARELKEGGGES